MSFTCPFLLCLLQSGLRTEPLTIVDNHLPVPNRHTSVSPLAPSAIPSTTDLSALPPSYRQISVSSPHHRELQHSEQTLVTQLGPSASPPSYNQLLVSNEHHRELQHSATHALSRLLAPTTCTRPSTETNIRRHLVEDPAQRSWRSYFNTADRLRELTGISPTHATFNETNVTPTCHQPRPQTPPPMYHEVEQTVARIARSDGLPSYDEFMATPSLVWYPCPSTNI